MHEKNDPLRHRQSKFSAREEIAIQCKHRHFRQSMTVQTQRIEFAMVNLLRGKSEGRIFDDGNRSQSGTVGVTSDERDGRRDRLKQGKLESIGVRRNVTAFQIFLVGDMGRYFELLN